MATRDILVLNTTASRAETQQGSDTVAIRGNSGEALSVENASGASILSVNTLSSSVDVAGKITATTNVSSSLSSTGSFGRVEATTLIGDAFNLTNTAIPGTISSSGQIASQISGAFRQGFEFEGTIGSVAGHTTTASFDQIVATVFSGSAANLTNTALQGTLSSSAQIASEISGAFTSGFEYEGTISGSVTSTGSFAQIFAKKAVGNVSAVTNLIPRGTISSSAQIASYVSGSFGSSGFEYEGTIQGITVGDNFVTNGTFDSDSGWTKETGWTITGGKAVATNAGATYTIYQTSAQTITANTTYRVTYTISDFTSSPSGLRIRIGSQLLGTARSSNGTFVEDVTTGGSIGNQGIGFYSSGGSNTLKIDDVKFQKVSKGTNSTSTGSFINIKATKVMGDVSAMTGLIPSGIVSSSDQIASNISGSFNKGFEFSGEISGSATSTGSFGRVEVTSISGDGSNLTNSALTGTISSSGQIASQISGAFTSGFTFSGDISMKDVVFSSGGDLNCSPADNCYGATYRGAAGNKNAGLVFGGFRYSSSGPSHYRYSGVTEEYDGTTWTEKNDMIDEGSAAGGGTSEAAIATGGTGRTGCTEEWNGTNWSEVNDQILSNYGTYWKAASIGQSSEALIMFGFNQSTPYGQTETWNGTNWATANQMIHDPRAWHGGAGTANAGLTAGGPYSPYNGVSCTETWNGTAWSEGPSALITNMKAVSMAGSSNDTILGGFGQATSWNANLVNNQPAPNVNSICWNGISWASATNFPSCFLGMAAAGESSDVAFFANGLERLFVAPYYGTRACTIETETFVASASFSHIDALRITASVDGMTNINPPEGAVSASAQIASNISGSFNKGFEFTGEIRSLGVWTSGASFPGNTGKAGYSAIGTRDAAIVAGAYGVWSGGHGSTYLYNGTSWSDTGHSMIQGGTHTTHGTANAGLAIGRFFRAPGTGYLYTCTEEYNGSSWSETTDLPYALTNISGQSAGTQNAALTAGGNCDTGNDADAIKGHALSWDGLSYTHVGDLNEMRDNAALAGTQNSALAQGGGSNTSYNGISAHSTCTEEWNGSAWSAAAASNFPAGGVVMAAGKSSNDAMHVYDCTNSDPKTDFYNGVAWSLGPNMNGLGSYKNSGATGTTGKSFFMAASCSDVEHFDENHVTSSIGRVDANELSLESDTDLTVNESLQIPQYATNPPITSSAGEVWYNTAEEKLYFTYDINSWTDITGMIQGRDSTGIVGSTGEALVAGGRIDNTAPYQSTCTELWNGTSWTALNAIGEAQSGQSIVGTACAAFLMSAATTQGTEGNVLWNGTNWSAGPDGGLGVGGHRAGGTANASIHTGGADGSGNAQDDTSEWNGTSFYVGGLMPANRSSHCQAGTQNTAYIFGGANPGEISTSDKYNGTSWSTDVNIPVALKSGAGTGTSNAAIGAGGRAPSNTPSTFEYNGTAWTTTVDLNRTGNALFNTAMTGNQSSALAVGGYGKVTCSETYTTTGIGCHCIGGV